jgi:hypothetical protein
MNSSAMSASVRSALGLAVSSSLPSEVTSLFAQYQLQMLQQIQGESIPFQAVCSAWRIAVSF